MFSSSRFLPSSRRHTPPIPTWIPSAHDLLGQVCPHLHQRRPENRRHGTHHLEQRFAKSKFARLRRRAGDLPQQAGLSENLTSANTLWGRGRTARSQPAQNQNVLYRIPRNPTVHTTTNLTGLGAIGYFVDGVAMFDSRDGFVWDRPAESGKRHGLLNREAYVNEGATFDPRLRIKNRPHPSLPRQSHRAPLSARRSCGLQRDHENLQRKHERGDLSIRRFSAGCVMVIRLRTLRIFQRVKLRERFAAHDFRLLFCATARAGRIISQTPCARHFTARAKRLYNTDQTGATPLSTYPVSRYMEDYAYPVISRTRFTGTNYQKGVNFDLDEYNGRWCVTPEFPRRALYAYFVSMSSNGTPVFPNNIGRVLRQPDRFNDHHRRNRDHEFWRRELARSDERTDEIRQHSGFDVERG